MPKSSIPAAVLHQRGVPITLIDGSTAVVVFTFSSLARIEAQYGSVGAALHEAQGSTTDAAVFSGLTQVLACGLEHETRGEGGAAVDLGDAEQLVHLLDSALVREYSKAIDDGFDKSFPKPEGDDAGDPQGPGEPASHGTSGSTSAQSPSDEGTTSSGE
jgi:hypothetical protein